MKTKLFFTALFAAATVMPSEAQSLLTDGKVWNCIQRMYNDQAGDYDRPFTITVCGDTTVCGTVCRRMAEVWQDVPQAVTYFAALEKDGRVYIVTDEGQREFLNFNLAVGDTDGVSGRVVAVNDITVGGIDRKCITIDRNGYLQYLVEGIGLSDNYLRDYEQTSFYTVLQSVTEHDVCVFTARDFHADTTNIHPAKSDAGCRQNHTFDLSGKQTTTNVNNTVVIKNGRKVLTR